MNESSANLVPYAVDWIRGDRDYVRAADLLNVAPIISDSQRIEFSFRSATICRGRWLRWDSEQELGSHRQVVAKLKIWTLHEIHRWDFVVDKQSPITKRLGDASEQSIVPLISFRDGCIETEMTDAFTIWEYLIVGTKVLGLQLYPEMSWYLVYILANLGQFPRSTVGCRLSVRLHRVRLAFHEFKFAIDGASVGLIGARERIRTVRPFDTDGAYKPPRPHNRAFEIEL